MKLQVLRSNSAAFKRWFKFLRDSRGSGGAGVEGAVATIVEGVKRRGDRALLEFTARYDRVKLTAATLRVSAAELKAARAALKPEERKALELAARRIRDFHTRTVDRSFSYRDRMGMRLGQVVRPLERIGIYVPGGKGAYPSSVLMNAIPAHVAGVREIVMVSPASPDEDRSTVLAAAAIVGLSEVYRIGGAQAVAALAYGTKSIRPVDKIVGPGNAYVQAAKRVVYGVVDIDKIAGPSEVLVIADDKARAQWVAADLIAQAEHGSGEEAAVLLTPSRRLASAVAVALEKAVLDLPRADAVRRALSKRGALVVVKDLAEAVAIATQIAPEHLELEIENPERWIGAVHSAGAVFVGSMSPAPLGDYVAGPNHVLPTGGAARFASPLGAYDFVKRTSIIQATPEAVRRLGPTVARLARMEGFEAHARAIEMRLGEAVGDRPGRISRSGRESK